MKSSNRLPPQHSLTQQACKIMKNQRAELLTRKLIRANTRIIRQKDNTLVQTKNKVEDQKLEDEKDKKKKRKKKINGK